MSEYEPGLPEIVRTLQRIERLLESFVTEKVYNLQVTAFNDRLKEVEDSIKWAMRLVVGAVILALVALVVGGTR